MSDTDIHSCGYYCDRPACIVAQRNELRDKLFEGQAVKTYSGGKPNYTQSIEKEWVGLTDEEIFGIFGTYWGDADYDHNQLLRDARRIEQAIEEKKIRTSERSIQISDTKPAESARSWVGLTDEDKKQIANEAYNKVELTAWELAQRFGEFTEAKLREKNA
jgi:hypothetical protein